LVEQGLTRSAQFIMYSIEIEHRGLRKHRTIRGRERAIVERKAALQAIAWDEEWEQKRTREARRKEQLNRSQEAVLMTEEAQRTLANLGSLLASTLSVDDAIDWQSLKRKDSFTLEPPRKPDRRHFAPSLGFLDRVLSSRKRRKIRESEERYRDALASWDQEQRTWTEQKLQFDHEIQSINASIDEQMARYQRGDPEAIAEYCDLVLSRSMYPDFMPQEAKVDYDPDTATLVVEYILPSPDDIPSLKEVRYVVSRGEFKETHLKDRERKELFDSVVYQIALRTVHEVFEADIIEAIDAVVFNGWVLYVDGRDGQDKKACIASLHATEKEFGRINLSAVNPRECFRSLKGVAAASLASLAPVAPVLQLNKDDRRFIQGKAVADTLDEGVNIAAMGWEEFEHLVRELFESEFSAGGGEVKVTQSSRDWGVDAVAFDPDPIRGGKIVIQAKRYTNP
jgi:restriction system protein